jgi:hypothetical protein
MFEDPAAWLIPAAAGAAVVLSLWLNARGQRRRVEHFRSLAAQMKAKATQSSEFNWSFSVQERDRAFTVEIALRGGGTGSSSSSTNYLVTSTALRGRAWDLHSVTIRRKFGRRRSTFEETFRVQEFGLPLREGWVTEQVRSAITAIDALPLQSGELLIEEGFLRHRVMGSINAIEPSTLKQLLTRMADLAAALERSRG